MRKWLGFALVFAMVSAWAAFKYQTVKRELARGQQPGGGAGAPAEKKTLRLFAMSDYFPPEIIEEFERKLGAKVKYDNFSNNEELLAKFQAGVKGYDVIVPSDYMVRALVEGGYLAPLDHAKIPNLKNLGPDFVNVPFDPGNRFAAAYTWGTTGLIYDSRSVEGELKPCAQLLSPRYRNKIALLDDMREVFGLMLHCQGHSSNSTQPDQLRGAQELLIKLKPSVRLFSSDPKQHLLSGDIWIAQIYSGDAYQLRKQRPELRYVVPQEGSTVWIDALAIPATAQDPELAHAFIDFILDPGVGGRIAEALGYSSPNLAAEPGIQDPSLQASHIRRIGLSKLEFLKDLGPASDEMDRLWTEAKGK